MVTDGGYNNLSNTSRLESQPSQKTTGHLFSNETIWLCQTYKNTPACKDITEERAKSNPNFTPLLNS
jgi:hypothetical protein